MTIIHTALPLQMLPLQMIDQGILLISSPVPGVQTRKSIGKLGLKATAVPREQAS